MSKNWVAVASAEQVRLGRSNGFMQVSHGKLAASPHRAGRPSRILFADRRVPRQRQAAILHGNRCRERRRSLSSRHGRRILPVPSTQSNRRGSDPYARWWGRGGIARCPPIPIVDPKPPFAARETSAARVQVFGPLVRKAASGLLHLQKKPTHAFSSRLSSFRKRQSVFSAMIFCGVDLMNPTSCSRRA